MPDVPIPAREGISPQRVVLRGVVPADRQYWAGSAGDSPFAVGERLVAGTILDRPVPAWCHPDVPAEPPIPFTYTVLSEDEDLIVVDKPHFLPSTSNGRIVRETVQTRLRVEYGEDEIVPLHRLDRLTSGVLICSRRSATRGRYQRLFQKRQVRKTYHARVRGPVAEGEVVLDLRKIPGQRAVSVVPDGQGVRTVTRLVAVNGDGDGDVVEIEPLTGHTHQIRAVLNHLGAPVVGDDTYPVDRGLSLYDFAEPLHLRATATQITDPVTGLTRVFRSERPLPPVR